MPRKTRKEKFAAKLNKQRIKVTTPLLETIEKETQTKDLKTPIQQKDFFDDNVRTYFLQDLRKSLVVITAILLLELTLFLANQAGLLNFINF